jgi:hypothetical protein
MNCAAEHRLDQEPIDGFISERIELQRGQIQGLVPFGNRPK